MQRFLILLLFCFGLIFTGAPLSYSDYSALINNNEIGIAAADCRSTHTWDGDSDCVEDLYQAHSPLCIADTPYCQCKYLGRECDTVTDPDTGGNGTGTSLTQAQRDAIAAVAAALSCYRLNYSRNLYRINHRKI